MIWTRIMRMRVETSKMGEIHEESEIFVCFSVKSKINVYFS